MTQLGYMADMLQLVENRQPYQFIVTHCGPGGTVVHLGMFGLRVPVNITRAIKYRYGHECFVKFLMFFLLQFRNEGRI